jgi:uncharacterized protein YndB with AHSA1/START domain
MPAASSTFKVTPQKDKVVVLTREFDAPRALVYKAMSDPTLIPKWWGRRKDTTTVDKMDVRVGGKWRFLTSTPGEEDNAFRGEFREIVPNERITWTFEWEGLPGHISVDTVVLEDLPGGRTRLTSTSVFETREDRDGMLQAGMEGGARETYDRLDELLAQLRTKK